MSLQDYQLTQTDLQNAVDARQKLEAQMTENEQVKKEFGNLKPHNNVYKLVGPVLLKQEQAEAKSNVNTRIDYIKGEIKRVENQIKELEAKGESQRNELVQKQAAEANQAPAG